MSNATLTLAEMTNPDAYSWQPLRILSIYRLIIVATVALTFLGAQNTSWIQAIQSTLFFEVTLSYLILSVIASLLAFQKWPRFSWQVHGQASIDVIAIALLIYASGSLESGLGILMVVAIAGLSILMHTQAALFFAALASILLLSLQVLSHLQTGKPGVGYTQAALLGMAVFITAIICSLLARRARHNQALADQRGHDLKSLEALNSHIVQRLPVGVVAVDADHKVRLLNNASWSLLGRPDQVSNIELHQLSTRLADSLAQWQQDRPIATQPLLPQGPDIALRFRLLGERGRMGSLIFLENMTETRAAVQQAKLASLGQLSANIAHEIRNPLSAISHAAQLLQESPDLKESDQRLLTIILNQSARLNELVQSVLQMSRRQPSKRQRISLKSFLPQLKRELREQHPHDQYQLDLHIDPAELSIAFDLDHLRQILSNLCQNAITHARPEIGPPHINLRAYRAHDRNIIEVADNGEGIGMEAMPHVFEPFYTTAGNGTGLGLYLCQELCESNDARLILVPQQSGACFRIVCTNNEN